MQTSLFLVIGTIAAAIGWLVIYPADGTESAEIQARAIMGNPNTARFGLLLGYGGLVTVFIGLINIARGITAAGGKGSSYTTTATILSIAVISGLLVGTGLELGTAETSSIAVGVTLMTIVGALDISIRITMGIALILLGTGMVFDKNLHTLGPIMAIISGAALVTSSFTDSTVGLGWLFQMTGCIGLIFTGLTLGILTIRSKR